MVGDDRRTGGRGARLGGGRLPSARHSWTRPRRHRPPRPPGRCLDRHVQNGRAVTATTTSTQAQANVIWRRRAPPAWSGGYPARSSRPVSRQRAGVEQLAVAQQGQADLVRARALRSSGRSRAKAGSADVAGHHRRHGDDPIRPATATTASSSTRPPSTVPVRTTTSCSLRTQPVEVVDLERVPRDLAGRHERLARPGHRSPTARRARRGDHRRGRSAGTPASSMSANPPAPSTSRHGDGFGIGVVW